MKIGKVLKVALFFKERFNKGLESFIGGLKDVYFVKLKNMCIKGGVL